MSSIILNHATVLTMDPDNPRVSIVAIKNDQITYVGNHFDEAMKNVCSDCKVIDMTGKTVLPGFNDNHVHLLSMAEFFSLPRLHGMTCDEIIDFLQKTWNNARPGEPLYAVGWDFPTCPDPHRSLLDDAFPDNPVYLIQFSGHGAWANSMGLHKLRINRKTPDPPGGKILHDGQGYPTGILVDSAVNKMHEHRIKRMNFNPTIRHRLFSKALELCKKAGITTIQDNTWIPMTVRYFKKVRDNGKLSARISCWAMGFKPLFAHLMRLQKFDEEWVRQGPWKYFLDGTFSTGTAWLHDPYHNQSGNLGRSSIPDKKLIKIVTSAARTGRQLAFHAIGDRAVTQLIDIVELVSKRYPAITKTRLRIEHAQLIRKKDLPRIRQLGILIAAQPTALGYPEKDITILGKERARSAYPYHSLLDAGIPLSFGSDIPGEVEYRPLQAIQNVVSRTSNEAITVEEAIYAYTMGSAYAEFMENKKGSITVGKLADITILSNDPTRVKPDTIADIEVVLTISGGRIVWDINYMVDERQKFE